MNWKIKAMAMRLCSALPMGASLYTLLQKRFGNLNTDPVSRICVQQEMVSWLTEAGRTVNGSVFLEVGTGHKPVIPICFSLMGAKKFITVDLNRRLDTELVKGVFSYFVSNREVLEKSWRDCAPPEIMKQRFDLLVRYQNDPELFFKNVGIHYHAPADAGCLSLPDESVDFHLSNTVFEHIPGNVISRIMKEAGRVLRKDGLAIHFIDLSDHFQHQDSSISALNFLRYSEKSWGRIAGNEFAYTNRMRPTDYLSIFTSSYFTILRKEINSDETILGDNVLIDPMFSSYNKDDVSATQLNVLLGVGRV